METFLLLDATDQAITSCWDRDDGVSVEEVQMKTIDAVDDKSGNQEQGEGAGAGGGGGGGGEEGDWVTLSSTLGSSALRKKKLAPGTAYVFRRRAKKQVCLRLGLSCV